MTTLEFPLSRITLFFVAGILFANFNPVSPDLTFSMLGFTLLIVAFFYYKTGKHFIQKNYFGYATYILSFTIGITAHVAHDSNFQKDNYIHHFIDADKISNVQIRLDEKLKNSVYKLRYIGTVKLIDGKKSSGKILINIDKDSLGFKPEIGNILQVKAKVVKHKPPNNPDQFDYGKYLARKSVVAQIYADKSNIEVSTLSEKTIWSYADKVRNHILENLVKSNFGKEELHIVMALILGQQQDISKEILQDYQYAGAVHILSVSGLHVGFILLFINFLLTPLPKTKSGNTIRFFILFITLWLFAIIAGMAPSVVRSVTMFTFVALGMCLKRETTIFHSLLVSILIILVVSPSFLFDVGFQLSYISLFFILWLQPLLSQLYNPKIWLAKKIWSILTVSVAAQVGALPLSVYYFHQFPGLFFITNLVIIPGIGIIMGIGVVVMILALFDYVPEILVLVLEILIFILNKIIKTIASFEQFIITDIPLNFQIMLVLYAIIVSVILWFKKPNFVSLYASLISLFILQLLFWEVKWKQQKTKELIVFQLQKNTLIGKQIGSHLQLYSNRNTHDNLAEKDMIKSYLVSNFSSLSQTSELKNTLYFKNKKIVLIDSLGIYPINCNADIIILTQSPKINLDRILNQNRPIIIIADGSNFKSYVSRWNQTCIKQKIPFHSTYEKGFYKLE